MSSVDVVVPCYNYARYLEQCVTSVLGQEGVDVRVLIIDDCSADTTPEVGRSLADRDPRVTFRRHDQNRGHIATYNEGLLDWASAGYSLLLSADDLLTPGALLRAVRVMDRYPDVNMTYGPVIRVWDGEEPSLEHVVDSDEYRIVSGDRVLRYSCEAGIPLAQTAAAVVRTVTQKQIGGYRVDLPHSGDMEMWMRFAVHGSVGSLRATQGFYRQHGRMMSAHYYQRSMLGDRRERLQAFEVIFEQWGSRLPNLEALRETAHRSLGYEALWLASRALDDGNVEGYRECLAFAEQTFPSLRGTSALWKLRVKRLVSPAIWQRIRPVLDRWRHLDSDKTRRQPGRYDGWWPD